MAWGGGRGSCTFPFSCLNIGLVVADSYMGVELRGGVESRVPWKLLRSGPPAPLCAPASARPGLRCDKVTDEDGTQPSAPVPWLTSWVLSESVLWKERLAAAIGVGP